MKPSHILIPTDFSQIARSATLLGAAIAERLEAKATLLHVLPHTPATRLLGEAYAVWTDRGESDDAAGVAERLEAAAEALPGGVGNELIWGHAVAGIVRYAQDHDVDLIVLGAFGRSALTTVGVGSIAERVARCAECSVLVARTASPQVSAVKPRVA